MLCDLQFTSDKDVMKSRKCRCNEKMFVYSHVDRIMDQGNQEFRRTQFLCSGIDLAARRLRG